MYKALNMKIIHIHIYYLIHHIAEYLILRLIFFLCTATLRNIFNKKKIAKTFTKETKKPQLPP